MKTEARTKLLEAMRNMLDDLHAKWMECLTGENPNHDISGWSVPMLTAIASMFEVPLGPLADRARAAKPYPKSWNTDDVAWLAGEGWQ